MPPGTVAGNPVQLRPNTTLATADTHSANPYFSAWWKPDAVGGYAPNRIVQDNFYIQNDNAAGDDVVLTEFAVANTLSAPYGANARAYIVDTFGPDCDLNAVNHTPLTPGQVFSVSLNGLLGHPVAYAIELVGPNARASALDSLGVVQVTAVPETSKTALVLMGLLGLGLGLGLGLRRVASRRV